MKALLDFIPLIAFFVAVKMYGVVAGAAALLVATVVIYALHFLLQKGKLDKQQWIVLILTIVFCGITVALNDDYYVKIKSPIINAVFAIALVASVLINKPIMKLAMQQVFTLSDAGWKKLTLAWAGFFALMGVAHYYTAFYMSNEVWVNFKTWGGFPIMLVFIVGQFFVLRKHINPDRLDKTQKQK